MAATFTENPMEESDVGKVFLLALQWDFTFVGRFIGLVGGLIVLEEAGYFRRTGKTFDLLCKEGFQLTGDNHTIFCASQAPRGRVCVANAINVKWEWEAQWPQPTPGGRRR